MYPKNSIEEKPKVEYDFENDEYFWFCPVCDYENCEVDSECLDCGWILEEEVYGEIFGYEE